LVRFVGTGVVIVIVRIPSWRRHDEFLLGLGGASGGVLLGAERASL
jgi:hypothetical protein